VTPLRFSFVLHIHQPVGNFDHVFREHADDVYTPFLDFLESRDLWPVGLHVSGPLVEWMGDHDVRLHDRIGRLVSDGRIELLSAGWYEPILAALPRVDRAWQLDRMRTELESRFGVTPTGAWLTERVWEPDLPSDLAAAGIEYVLVDDHLALRAGVPKAALGRPLRAEADGRYVDLLAIDEGLRYLIPFRPADEIATELRARHARGETLALIGDDGEKFGGWPRTKEWLYEGGWLEAFGDRMDELRAEGVVRLVTPAQARSELEATGPVYLPTGSYPEMEGWARGGHWKGFLSRYPEANRMHKRMLALSAIARERGDPPDARLAIARAQCNDAYWHGVFGGLYMKHLREGVRRQMILAERLLRAGQPFGSTRADVDGDGRTEWWVHGPGVSAWVREDGAVTDLIHLGDGTDVLDVLTRYREAYHEEALRRGPGGGGELGNEGAADREAGEGRDHGEDHGDAAPSIHDIEEAATLHRLPPEDAEVRVLVRERVLPASLELHPYAEGAFEPVWAADSFVAEVMEEEALARGFLRTFRTTRGPEVEKRLEIRADGTVIHGWRWNPADFPDDAWFAPEVSLGADVGLATEPEAEAWRYLIVTTSKCPDGFEQIEQGTSVTPRWPAALGEARLVLAASTAAGARTAPER